MRRAGLLIVIAMTSFVAGSCGATPPGPSGTPISTASVSPGANHSATSQSPTGPTRSTGLPTPAAPSENWTGLRWAAPALTAPYETISDVVAWDGRYVAVGQLQETTGAGGTRAEAWTSTDWRTWATTLVDSPTAGDSELSRVVAVGGRLVAIGTSGELRCAGPAGAGQRCRPAPVGVWTSADGRSWHREAAAEVLAGVAVDAVASNGRLVVLAGDTGWGKPGVWTSADGVSWQRANLPTGAFSDAHFVDLAAAPIGLVLTGSRGGKQPTGGVSGDSGATPAAWYSPDGTAWRAADVGGDARAPDDEIAQVFVGRAGLVAWAGKDASFGWVSPDGRAWSSRPKPTGYPIIPRASDGSRIVADSYAEGGLATWWASSDGLSWQALGSSGDTAEAPGWGSGSGASADAEFLVPDGLGLVGQNGSDRFPLWFAQAVTSP